MGNQHAGAAIHHIAIAGDGDGGAGVLRLIHKALVPAVVDQGRHILGRGVLAGQHGQ